MQVSHLVLLTAFVGAAGAPLATAAAVAPDTSVAAGERALVTYLMEDFAGDVQLGTLGLARANDPSVRRLAQAMVRDHQRTGALGRSVARDMGEAASSKPDSSDQIDLTHLARYTGAKFDREYVKTLIDAHKSDIGEIKDALEFARTPALRSALESTLAIDERHLQLAEAAQQRVGSGD